MKIKAYLAELRAPFFTATIIPVILGTAVAWQAAGEFHLRYFLAALIGGILLHAGANVTNDYFDHKNNSDNINREFVRPFSGGSRLIQDGVLSPKQVFVEALICYALALAIGIWLIDELGLTILWLGLIGALCGFFYTAPPVKLASRGLGELIIGINFGFLMTLGSYFVQTGELSWTPLFVAAPIAFLIAAIVYINEFPDYNADKEAGKKHLVVRLGQKRSAKGYMALLANTYAVVFIETIFDIIPLWGSLAISMTLPIAIKAVKVVNKHYKDSQKLRPACTATIILHILIGLILSATHIM